MNSPFTHRVARLSEWHRIKSMHHRGKEVRVIVVRVYGHALLCRVGSFKGPPAIIRRRELSWNAAEQRTSGYREGDSFEAVVVEYGEEHRELVLSKKRTEVLLADTFPIGEEFSGTIMDVPAWGYTVHLEGGVDGFLLRQHAPDQSELTPTVRLQVGDRVRAEVIGYDEQQGNPRLSMIRSIVRHQETIRQKIESLASYPSARQMVGKVEAAAVATNPFKPLSILVLDDTESVVLGMKDLLQSEGHEVITAVRSEELPNLLLNCPPLDVALLDIQLDFESLRSSNQPIFIHTRFPRCRVYLFTGNESVLDGEDLRNLRDHIHGVIPKAWSPQHILDVLHGARRAISTDELARTLSRQNAVRSNFPVPDSGGGILIHTLKNHLPTLEAVWKGCRLLVAEYDLPTTRLHVLKTVGFPPGPLDGLGKSFLDSELGDVLKDMKPLGLTSDQQPTPAVKDFFRTLATEWVVAIPVRIDGYPRHVAAFCFGAPGETRVPDHLQKDLERALSQMALVIERELFESRIFKFQKAAGAGALVLGMTHELRNLMSPVLTGIETIRRCVENPSRLAKLPERFLETSVSRATEASRAMQSVMEGFLRMTKPDEEEEIPLIDILQEVVSLCRDSARQHDVYLNLNQNESSAMDMILPSSIRQVFMNVILNGTQHVAQTDVKHKLITITVRPVNGDGLLRIDITDNGYGVAANQRESMFEMFVTTRPSGTGLGLFVAKEILSLVGGEIRMKSDCMRYRDNTFSIFLPVPKTGLP